MKVYYRTDLAYCAGLLDGEGHIGITLRKNLRSGHQLRVEISNTNEALIKWLLAHFDGHGASRKDRWGDGDRKDSHVWYADNRKAVRLLRLLMPYLVLKKEQAQIAIDFQAAIQPHGKGHSITDEMFASREGFRLRIRALNKRGRG